MHALAAAARRAGLVPLMLGVLACSHVRPGQPALFPMTSVFSVPLDAPIEGPLATDGTRVFVATRTGLVALGANGEIAWQSAGAAATGALAAGPGALIVHGADGTVASLDPANGSLRWRVATTVSGALPPVLDRDRVLVAGNGIAALDLPSGRVLWLASEARATTTPAAGPSWIVAGESEGALRCRDRATGLERWTYHAKGASFLAPPLVDRGKRVLVGTTDRRILALDPRNGRVVWSWKVGADVQDPAAILHDLVLVPAFDAVLYGMARGSGNLELRIPLPSRPLSGPLLAKDSVIVACSESDVVGFSGRTGQSLGSMKTPDEIRTPPLLVGDRLYVGLRNKSVVAYELDMTEAKLADKAPQRAGTQPPRGPTSGAPSVPRQP